MFEDIPVLGTVFHYFLIVVMIVLAVMLIFLLVRLILGPSVADRVLSVNMIGTMVNAAIVTLALLLGESYLLDINLVYAMLSFLAVVLLAQVYIGVSREHFRKEEEEEEDKDDDDT